MVSLDEQIKNCGRIRAIVIYNPRPRFYTVNTTRDSRNREKLIITLTRDVGPLLPYRFPVVIHLLVSQRQANRYDTKALNSVVDNCELGPRIQSH